MIGVAKKRLKHRLENRARFLAAIERAKLPVIAMALRSMSRYQHGNRDGLRYVSWTDCFHAGRFCTDRSPRVTCPALLRCNSRWIDCEEVAL